jgi:hypothetical protein
MTKFPRLTIMAVTTAVMMATACGEHAIVDPVTGATVKPGMTPGGRSTNFVTSYVHIDGSSCADVKANNPGALDGVYIIAPTSGPAADQGFAVYCANMSSSPAEYITLASTGVGANTSMYPGSHKTWSYQGFPIRVGTDARTQYLKLRVDPATLVVDQNDRAFINAISIGVNPVDPTNSGFNPTPKYATYGSAADCYGIGSQLGTANIDLHGTVFALGDAQTFSTGGFGPAGTQSVSADRQVVNLTGGGWCGGTGPDGGLTLKVVTAYQVDRTAPVTATSAPAGWVNHDVTLTLTATDEFSGVASTNIAVDGGAPVAGTSVELTTDGSHTVEYWSVDNQGNVETHHSATVQIDKTAPTISGVASTTAWTNQNVVVTFNCADNLSGVQSCTSPATVTSEGANQSVSGTVQDKAGNHASTTVANINIDKTAPVIGYTGDAGAYTLEQHVAIHCAANDVLSGLVVNTCADVNADAFTLALGNHTLSATAQDRAGNSNAATATFTISATSGSLCSLVQRWTSNAGVANSLCVKLQQGSYEAFRNEVSAQSGKKISEANAAMLIELSKAL